MYSTIKVIAKERGISIRQIEHMLGISQGSICKWDKVNPSCDKVVGVARILGVTVEDIVRNEKEN